MPAFEPGHPYHPPRTDVIGAHAPSRKAQRALAALLDEVVDYREMAMKLVDLARGRDALGNAVDGALQHAAIRTLLERRYGVPTQDVRIEAQLQAVVAVGQVGAPLDLVDSLPAEELLQLEQTLARLGITGPVADAESAEEP